LKSVELFSGCGGLALGLARAGFKHEFLVEWDEEAVQTLQNNRRIGLEHIRDWTVALKDAQQVDWTSFHGKIDLVAGGPPCQPFSIGGRHRGHEDDRDMWPEAIRAVNEVWPSAFLFENVRGLARPAFGEYFAWIQAALRRPHINRRKGETHEEHYFRLEQSRSVYDVVTMKVNAADFGAPQKRHRVIIAGLRRDLGVQFSLPQPRRSRERLVWEQSVTGEYWSRHRIRRPQSPSTVPSSILPTEPHGAAWVTVRDALKGLGEPNGRRNHVRQEGARRYIGHTGSPLDEPAKALKAGDHGVPGGENMMVSDDGSVRYFTVREAARLQGLPDDYVFDCTWSDAMRQLGNAVPTQMSEELGLWLKSLIS